jgi:hypothetical protein
MPNRTDMFISITDRPDQHRKTRNASKCSNREKVANGDHGFWSATPRQLDARVHHVSWKTRKIVARYWDVVVASVPVAARGTLGALSLAAWGELVATLSFDGAETTTVRVLVLVRPLWSVTT